MNGFNGYRLIRKAVCGRGMYRHFETLGGFMFVHNEWGTKENTCVTWPFNGDIRWNQIEQYSTAGPPGIPFSKTQNFPSQRNKKLRYREEHSASVVLSRCTLWHLSGDKQQLINHCTKLAMKPTEFREITQNNGHYNVQGRSRSPILIPIESPYTTSY